MFATFRPTRKVMSAGRALRVTQYFASAKTEPECKILLDSVPADIKVLPYGAGQSLGDSCLNEGGALLSTRDMNRVLDQDSTSGSVTVEAGVSMAQLLDLAGGETSKVWFPSVLPGNMIVTVGGAIANDVHGKNHPLQGSFCHQVESLKLLRSDGVFTCSENENSDLFHATLGGLGLTGIVTTATLRLREVVSPVLDTEEIRCDTIEEAFSLFERDATPWEYQFFWFDPFDEKGRGIFTRARHCADSRAKRQPSSLLMKAVSCLPMPSILGGSAVWRSWYALLLLRAPRHRPRQAAPHNVLAPLGEFSQWNRLFGPSGLLHLQLVVPNDQALAVLRSCLKQCRVAGQLPYVASCKIFGSRSPAGMLSFPRAGVTVALDFANAGSSTRALLTRLQMQIVEAGGAVYPGKDSTMPPVVFRRGFPLWEKFGAHVDPKFSSNFWRRVA
jgi:FAD/FMN-containing dehydrogenase